MAVKLSNSDDIGGLSFSISVQTIDQVKKNFKRLIKCNLEYFSSLLSNKNFLTRTSTHQYNTMENDDKSFVEGKKTEHHPMLEKMNNLAIQVLQLNEKKIHPFELLLKYKTKNENAPEE